VKRHLVPFPEEQEIRTSSPLEWSANMGATTPLFHRPEWEQVFAVYGLKLRMLEAVRDGNIVGRLPLVSMRSRLFGNQLVSLPWFDALPAAAVDNEVQIDLVNQALELAEEWQTESVQIRQFDLTNISPHVRTDKIVQRLHLERDPDVLWSRLKPSVRNQIRKAKKSGLVVERGGADLAKCFFDVYSRNMRDLGTPSHSRRLFEVLLDVFASEATVYLVRHENKVVGGGLTLDNGETLEIPWASSLREYNSYCVNHAMYWRILEDACRDGYEWFSFGRSTRGSGPYRYKKQWQPDEMQLYWYFLSRSDAVAKGVASPPQEKFGRASRIWQHLPLWLSRSIGPWIMSQAA